MAYEPTVWKSGDVVTSAKLNKIEQGIANAGVLLVGMDMQTMVLDHTYAEITAGYAVLRVEQGGMVQYAPLVGSADAAFTLLFLAGNQQMTFVAESANGYPVYSQSGGGGTVG